ncbi:type VII secretion-associated serine protease mycosin [Planomonospora alba]|uniref:Type VII secretion-associated serine protease mycosin n=1 Tax=Planomonospora alba TaxID=161354 RepID=A0ABP6NT39_9ACTN
MSCPRVLGAALALAALTASACPSAWSSAAFPGGAPAHAARPDARAETRPDRQWALDAVDAPRAWRTTRGEGVTVAVLDTGVDAGHPDLAGAVVEGPDLTGTGRKEPFWGRHGTAMASVIAGRGRGGGGSRGVTGVAPAATILSVRVALENDDPRRGRARERRGDALARGIRYAVDHGAHVISMSLGGSGGSWQGSRAEESAVRYALDRGAVLVASSGNDGAGPNRKNFPAAYPGVIAVGAVDEDLRVPAFSNRQDYLSVVAPGRRILTAGAKGSYVVGDGTSAAAALVAGVAALIRSEFPGLGPAQVRRAIERGAVRAPDHVSDRTPGHASDPGSDRTPGRGHDPAYGHGVVNAARALEQAAGMRRRPLRATAPRWSPPGGILGEGSRRAVCALLVLAVLVMAAHRLLRSRPGGRGLPGSPGGR